MNISKIMKKKRDAEARLNKTSPIPNFVVGGGSGGGDAYITYEQIINNINNVITNQLIAGSNITLTDNLDGTFTISGQAGETTQRDLLTNGSLIDTELLFADGDVIWVEV